ncbi:MAG: hypothetical protein K2G20_08405, partial [Lachnospiraceae bacterium]|nr:hypothetical protein [Lachnospiraceae bacterium]
LHNNLAPLNANICSSFFNTNIVPFLLQVFLEQMFHEIFSADSCKTLPQIKKSACNKHKKGVK